MRSNWRILAVAMAASWLAPQLAAGEATEDQLRALNERMAQMEQRLTATQEELTASQQRVEQQQAVIQELDADRGAASGLSKFLSETEFSGAVAGSYTYNFRNFESSAVDFNSSDTIGGENLGFGGITAPHHSSSNTFQVDQLYIAMRKQPTPESRAGWGATIAFGVSADSLTLPDSDDLSGNLTHLYEAYASYLFDCGEGVNFTLGRYATVTGAETFLVDQNLNVTRGLLWALQPVNHTGAYVRGTLGEVFTWQLGASNSYGNTMADTDSHPTFVGSVGFKQDTMGLKVNGVYGGDVDDLLFPIGTFTGIPFFDSGVARNGDKVGLLDVVLNWDPSERLATWLNFDMYKTDNFFDTNGLTIYGIGGAGRYAITDATGFGLRYEWMLFDDFYGFDATMMELTGTLDHRLTDNLVASIEARWDRGDIESFPDIIFLSESGSSFVNDNQVMGVVQLRYEF